jgi:hypothetical protein
LNKFYSGRLSFYTSLFVVLVSALIKVKSIAAYNSFFDISKCGTSVVLTIAR